MGQLPDISRPPRLAGLAAFFGGSFDPPHLGHLAVARAARSALSLDAVLFAPVGSQPLKPQGSTAAFEDRLAMTQLAIVGEPGFAISLADAPASSGAPNYTLETLLALRAELTNDGTLFCLMGADSFRGLRHWHRAAEVPFAAQMIVASRPGQSLDDLAAALPAGLGIESAPDLTPDLDRPRSDGSGLDVLGLDVPVSDVSGSDVELRCFRLRNAAGQSTPFYLLSGLDVEISATEIRERVRAGSGSELLPVAVADYIRSHNLYQ
jgi:nicotinate-nucleotide adenylyltransferase